MYMEKEVPSYIEYPFLCKKNEGCGSIIINLDGDDVPVVMSSSSDIPVTELLLRKSGFSRTSVTFYYLSPFNIYVKNMENGQLRAIDPQIDSTEDMFEPVNEKERREMNEILEKQKSALISIFTEQQNMIRAYKQSYAFQNFLKEKEDNIVNALPAPNTWRYVPGNHTSGCNSRVPCYRQYTYKYREKTPCLS